MADEKSKLLFIVKSKESNGKGFETFLRNRKWDLFSSSDLQKAIAMMLKQPIHCALITVDHPNPKCNRLPNIIAQTIQVPVILFAEGYSQAGIQALGASGHPYILYPPVSGPAVERMLLRIEKDLLAAQQSSPGQRNTSGLTSSTEEENYNRNLSGKRSPSLADIVQLFEGDGQSALKSAESGRTFGGNGDNTQTSDATKFSTLLPGETEPSSLRHLNGTQQIQSLPRSDNGTSEAPVTIDDSGSAHLIKGAEHALSQSSVGRVAPPDLPAQTAPGKATSYSRVSCFEIRTSKLSGYIIVARCTERNHDDNINESIKLHLLEYLNTNGISTTSDDLMNLRLSPVNFEDWSIEEAMFLRKSVQSGSAVALAFFPYLAQSAPLELSPESQMFRIGLHEISVDYPLEFDIYLHLAANKKYIRYAAKDRKIIVSQRERLQSSGIQYLHVRADAARDLMRYRVQNFLNDNIKEYKAKKPA